MSNPFLLGKDGRDKTSFPFDDIAKRLRQEA